MKLDDLKIVVDQHIKEDEDAGFFIGVVHFQSTGAKLEGAPTVCMSRTKKIAPEDGGCWFPIDALQEHNYHAPAFKSKEDPEEYRDRVMADVEAAAATYNGPVAEAG